MGRGEVNRWPVPCLPRGRVPARRLPRGKTPPARPEPAASAGRPASLPLAQLLLHVADAVRAVRSGESLTAALARCPAPARPGTQALSFDVLRQLGTALALRAALVPKPPQPAVDALLLAALALLWPTEGARYAEHTLVDQAVAAARKRHASSAAFINAVLRRMQRDRAALQARIEADPVATFNHPRWWIERMQADWPAQWRAVLAANDQHPPMGLRVNARRGDAGAYVARLAEAGIGARTVAGWGAAAGLALATDAVLLDVPSPVGALPGFGAGDVSVQDLAAQLAAPLLLAGLPAQGAHVLDACAAPGGKTAHLLERADCALLAIDSDAQRLKRVDETLARLGLMATVRVADAGAPEAWWDGQPFDRILLDAPCSGSGVVRRHPDIRWLRRAADIAALAATQARLLDACWRMLAPGGRLLYCTCSVFKAEGRAQIDAFVQRQPDAVRVREPASPGHLLPLADNDPTAATPAPAAPADGFYYALLQKS